MKSNFEDVGNFHEKFGLDHHLTIGKIPHLLDDNIFLYRLGAMLEEIVELQQAHQKEDLAKVADGIVDLVYFALGTAHMMHLPWHFLWNEVQRANMAKERGPTEHRGHHLDIRKPEGWKPPDIENVLRHFGAKL